MDQQYLKLRHRTWFARVMVPLPLRKLIGRSEIERSLKTHSLEEARRLRHRVVAEILAEIERARLAAQLAPSDAERVVVAARMVQQQLVRGTIDNRQAEVELDRAVEVALDAGADEDTIARASRLGHAILAGNEPVTLEKLVCDYLAHVKPHITVAGYEAKERHLKALVQHFGVGAEVTVLTRKACSSYVTLSIVPKEKAPKTKKDEIANLVSWAEWLTTTGWMESNPFSGLTKLVKVSKRGVAKGRKRPYATSELLTLWDALPGCASASSASVRALAALVPLGLYTGCRIDELASLRLADVRDDRFQVNEGKNDSSLRTVPLQLRIRPLVARLRAEALAAGDTYLIIGLEPGGRDGKRSHEASKAFGRLVRRVLPSTEGELDCHSLRRSHAQRAISAGVLPLVHDLLVGHRDGSMIQLYGQYADFDTLLEAAEKIRWPELPFD